MLATGILILTLLPAQAAGLPGLAPENRHEEIETAGWVESGRKLPFVPDPGRGPDFPVGGWERFSPARLVHALCEYSDTLWIGSDGGLFAFSILEDTLVAVPGPASFSITDVIATTDGELWVGGAGGLSVRTASGWNHYTKRLSPVFDHVTELTPGEEGIWIGSFGNGAAHLRADSMTVYSRRDSLLDDRVLAVAEGTDRSVWFGTTSGLCLADSFHWESMRYGRRIPIGAVEDIVTDEEGNVFLAVQGAGVTVNNLGRIRRYTPREGLPSLYVHAFSLDTAGRVWAAGKGGVSIYDGSGWVPFRLPGFSLAGHDILSIHHDIEGNTCIGTADGRVFFISREAVREVTLPSRLPDARVSRIRAHGGVDWFLTGAGIAGLADGTTEIPLPASWYAQGANDFLFDSTGSLWIATRFGILRRTSEGWEVYDRRNGLPTEHFTCAEQDGEGRLWFGTFDAGVLVLSREGWARYSRRNGLADDRITGIIVDGTGTIWTAGESGAVLRFKNGEWEKMMSPDRSPGGSVDTLGLDPRIRFLAEAAGDAGDAAGGAHVALARDASGSLLLARYDGVYRFGETGWQFIEMPSALRGFDPSAVHLEPGGVILLGTRMNGLFVFSDGKWNRGAAAGLPPDEQINTIGAGTDGSVWIGTQLGGAVRIRPAP